ncbi:arylesterase [Pedobacter sp. SAFR-022]|uniref:arylesterase n=1 Tax=Pedobacter sp. SAFR-022 TaxID=3436861 RepID=UPI003F816055
MTLHRFSRLWFLLLTFLVACGNSNNNTADSQAVKVEKKQEEKRKTVLFFGDSLTAGYGLEDPEAAFPYLIEQKIDSLNLPYKVVSAGLSGETSAGGKNRIDWLLKQQMDVFVLELGANDGLRGLDVKETEKNLQSIIDQVHAKFPETKLVITGMMVPPSMGAKYADAFKGIFPRLAKKNNAAFIPFLLEGVGGVPELNQGDGIHPTVEGHKILADNVWTVLKDVL